MWPEPFETRPTSPPVSAARARAMAAQVRATEPGSGERAELVDAVLRMPEGDADRVFDVLWLGGPSGPSAGPPGPFPGPIGGRDGL